MRIKNSIVLLASAALLACDAGTGPGYEGNITGQPESVFYTESLGIDLDDFTRFASGLYVRDVVQGAGNSAVRGQTAIVRYTGWLANGRVFDSGQLTFELGGSQVVDGFEEGVLGMNVGGLRMLILPPHLGYGGAAQSVIPANAVLIFEVSLLAVSQLSPD